VFDAAAAALPGFAKPPEFVFSHFVCLFLGRGSCAPRATLSAAGVYLSVHD
jgi:hypothetical protein